MGKLKKTTGDKIEQNDFLGVKSKTIIKPSSTSKKSLKEKIRSRIGFIDKKSALKLEKNAAPKKKTPKKLRKGNKVKPTNTSIISSALEEKYKLKADTVISGCNGVLKLLNAHLSETKKQLFDDEQPIFLQITCIKIPVCPERILRIPLKHSLLTESSEICLIVPDVRGIPIKEYERVIEHYEQHLRSKNVTNIKTVIPYHQLKAEYGQFELKRRLVELYDVFLVDGKISGYVVHQLGKIFYNKRKIPTPIKLQVPKLKESIDKALLKMPLSLHGNGDTFNVQVGHSKMEVEKVAENIFAAVEELDKQFPGGWDNVRGLYVKSSKTESVPIYLTLKSKDLVEVPLVQPKRPKENKPVSGELSTRNNAEVVVLPTGDVIVNYIQKKKDDDENEENIENEESDNVENDDKQKENQKKVMKKRKLNIQKEESDEVDESDEEVDENDEAVDETYTKEELAYLLEMQNEESSTIDEDSPKKKKKKNSVNLKQEKMASKEVKEKNLRKKNKKATNTFVTTVADKTNKLKNKSVSERNKQNTTKKDSSFNQNNKSKQMNKKKINKTEGKVNPVKNFKKVKK